MVKEFPDKILLVKDDIDDIVQNYWVLRNLTQCKDSEYIRKDVVDDMLEKLIEKACKWLEDNLSKQTSILCSGVVYINFNSVITNFRKSVGG